MFETMSIVLLLICAFLLCLFVICIVYYKKKIDGLNKENLKLNSKYDDTKLLLGESVNNNSRLLQENMRLREENSSLLSSKNSKEQVEKYKNQLQELEQLLSFNVAEIDNSQARLSELNSLIDTKNSELTSMERRIIEDEASAQKLQNNIKDLENYEKILQEDLIALQTTHRNALMVVDGDESSTSFVTFTFASLTANERRICELIKEIIVDYPELSVELGKIVWSKVWMPKIQSIIKREDFINVGHYAIYKLTSISNPTVCYVGQAVDVKERWYTHIKKMVGAEVKGGEKLYNNDFLPSDFTWSILEWGLASKSILDERERYWIDFFGGVELGLNSK